MTARFLLSLILLFCCTVDGLATIEVTNRNRVTFLDLERLFNAVQERCYATGTVQDDGSITHLVEPLNLSTPISIRVNTTNISEIAHPEIGYLTGDIFVVPSTNFQVPTSGEFLDVLEFNAVYPGLTRSDFFWSPDISWYEQIDATIERLVPVYARTDGIYSNSYSTWFDTRCEDAPLWQWDTYLQYKGVTWTGTVYNSFSNYMTRLVLVQGLYRTHKYTYDYAHKPFTLNSNCTMRLDEIYDDAVGGLGFGYFEWLERQTNCKPVLPFGIEGEPFITNNIARFFSSNASAYYDSFTTVPFEWSGSAGYRTELGPAATRLRQINEVKYLWTYAPRDCRGCETEMIEIANRATAVIVTGAPYQVVYGRQFFDPFAFATTACTSSVPCVTISQEINSNVQLPQEYIIDSAYQSPLRRYGITCPQNDVVCTSTILFPADAWSPEWIISQGLIPGSVNDCGRSDGNIVYDISWTSVDINYHERNHTIIEWGFTDINRNRGPLNIVY